MTLPTGIAVLDHIFDGGLQEGMFTHIYGEASSGKTTLALMFVKSAFRLGIGSIVVNSEGTTIFERLEQIVGHSFKEMEGLVHVFVPKSFSEQGSIIEDLELYAREGTGLVVIDTMTRLYRVALEDKNAAYVAHRELNRQAGILKGLTRHKKMTVLALNQVRGVIDNEGGFEPVAKNIMDYWEDYSFKILIGRTRGERVVTRIVPPQDSTQCILYLSNTGFETRASS